MYTIAKMRAYFHFLYHFIFLIYSFSNVVANSNDKNVATRSLLTQLLPEISRTSKIASRFVSGAAIPEIIEKPKRGAKISTVNNYNSAMMRRKLWHDIILTTKEEIMGHNITISKQYIENPPPVQAFMKSESPIELNSQCLNAFNYFYVYPDLIKCEPKPTKETIEILFRYICMNSVIKVFNGKWVGSIFILREMIEKSLYFLKKSSIPESIVSRLIEEYESNMYHELVPFKSKLGKHVYMDTEGVHIWNYIVNRSRLLYSIDSPTRAPRRGEWAFVLISGNPTPKEFLFMRSIRFISVDSVQLLAAIIFTMLLFKLKNPSQFTSYELVIEDYNKALKKTVNSNLLLAFSARIAHDFTYANIDWNEIIDTLLEIDLEESTNGRRPTFIWDSKPLISLTFEPDITIPEQLVSNCIRFCEDLLVRKIVTFADQINKDDTTEIQKRLENVCTKLQEKILPFKEIVVDPDTEPRKSILKTPMGPAKIKKKLRFNTDIKFSTFDKYGKVGDRTEAISHPLGISLKTNTLKEEGSYSGKPEIPVQSKELIDEEIQEALDKIDSNDELPPEFFEKTPYPIEEEEESK
ncbi:hypothetical protein FG379_000318 [Cryptosporidium bovis]|uniref:uncharacterized protein n=1 Tax=Cryptosporidium bovis TaxID=310047 RepID=UPI003519E4EA|nr:hypothetical protein FG379_000318 [Cryptosporidium bovis]